MFGKFKQKIKRKNKLNNNTKMVIILFILTIIFVSYNVFFRNTESYALSKYGSRGSEVTQIQTKLKRWGYYNGNIDGIYGSQTLAKWSCSRWNCRDKNFTSHGNIYI